MRMEIRRNNLDLGEFGFGPGCSFLSLELWTSGLTSWVDLGIRDSAQKELVWREVATKTLDPNAKPDKKQKNSTKAIEKLFKNFPPPLNK